MSPTPAWRMADTTGRRGAKAPPLDTARGAGDRLEAFYVLAVRTGMRPGELLGLKWEDVDLREVGASLRVNRALSGGKFTPPKTNRSRRRIDLDAASVAALKAHRRHQLEERMQRGEPWEDHGLVFPSSIGTPCPITPS